MGRQIMLVCESPPAISRLNFIQLDMINDGLSLTFYLLGRECLSPLHRVNGNF